MIPAAVPCEVVFRLPPEAGSRAPIYEEHPVVGWSSDTMEPLILHWRTGRPVPVAELLAERGDVISLAFRATPVRVDPFDLETLALRSGR